MNLVIQQWIARIFLKVLGTVFLQTTPVSTTNYTDCTDFLEEVRTVLFTNHPCPSFGKGGEKLLRWVRMLEDGEDGEDGGDGGRMWENGGDRGCRHFSTFYPLPSTLETDFYLQPSKQTSTFCPRNRLQTSTLKICFKSQTSNIILQTFTPIRWLKGVWRRCRSRRGWHRAPCW